MLAQDTPTASVTVRAQHNYPIFVRDGLSADFPDLIGSLHAGRVALVTSPNVWQHQSKRLRRLSADPIIVPDGERAKTLRTVERVYREFLARGVDRHTLLCVAGGGVLGDLVGFAASSFVRGVPVVHIPTTLVAQVDSAIGGKVGVNLRAGKNLVGAFYQPRAVLVDPQFLGTLPVREMTSGIFEVIKYGIIASPDLLVRIADLPRTGQSLQRARRALAPIIDECCGIKARIVTKDERDEGLRLILNFGHTVGHALESVTQYRRFRHGEAVGHGMRVALEVSRRRGLLREAERAALDALIASFGPLPSAARLDADAIVSACKLDKKRRLEGSLTMVLSKGAGRTVVHDDVTKDEVVAALQVLSA